LFWGTVSQETHLLSFYSSPNGGNDPFLVFILFSSSSVGMITLALYSKDAPPLLPVLPLTYSGTPAHFSIPFNTVLPAPFFAPSPPFCACSPRSRSRSSLLRYLTSPHCFVPIVLGRSPRFFCDYFRRPRASLGSAALFLFFPSIVFVEAGPAFPIPRDIERVSANVHSLPRLSPRSGRHLTYVSPPLKDYFFFIRAFFCVNSHFLLGNS